MKEYRIKAKNAEHRKAIIGALEGLGYEWPTNIKNEKGHMSYPIIRVCEFPNITGSMGVTRDEITHTSLDSMIEDIIRDRQTVDIDFGSVKVGISPSGICLDTATDGIYFSFDEYDLIAEAVAKVRGRV